MNTLETVTMNGPYGKQAECIRFTIDDVTDPFVLHDSTVIGQRYTFSLWLMSDSAASLSVVGDVFNSTNVWSKHFVTFTASDTSLSISFDVAGTYYIYHPQLEIGTVATDWTPAPEDAADDIASAADNLREDMAEQSAATLDSCNEMLDSVLGDYVSMSEYGTFKASIKTNFEILNGEINMSFESIEGTISELDGRVQAELQNRSKNISFSDEGIAVTDSDGIYSIQVDNVEGVTIRKNGEIRSQLIDDDFYTGNIVVEVNERAQFGNFAFVPRSDGSLSFLKVGE